MANKVMACCEKCGTTFEYVPFHMNSTKTGKHAPLPKCPNCVVTARGGENT